MHTIIAGDGAGDGSPDEMAGPGESWRREFTEALRFEMRRIADDFIRLQEKVEGVRQLLEAKMDDDRERTSALITEKDRAIRGELRQHNTTMLAKVDAL